MNLKDIYPLGVSMDPEEGIPGFLRSLLIRTNFVANTRSYLGWRGLKPSFRNGEAWTCRIKDKKGVFGIYFKEFTQDASWLTGKFSLSYFPQPDEDIVEFFSIAAGAHTQLPDYINQVREFLCYPGFARLFEVADIYFSFSISADALLLTLRAPEVLKTICVEGIEVENEGQSFYLLDLGGIDSNLPAFDLALPFYEVLAATLTYNLSQAPSVFRQLKCIEKSTGISKNITAAESVNVEMNLGYGDAEFQSHLNVCNGFKEGKITDTIFWKTGLEIPAPFKDELWWDVHRHKHYSLVDKSLLGIDDRPQFIVLSGFLGSGKTSFLQNCIEYHTANNRFVAVIQNEVGEVGLDGKLLEDDYAVLEMDEGCVCCSLIGQLKKGINQILANFHPDVIILETSGLANPYNLLADIAELEDRIRFDSVTVLVDASNFDQNIREYEVAREQIKAADILLLNKIDLVSDPEIRAISRKLKEINPNVPILNTTNGQINPGLMYGTDDRLEPRSFKRKTEGLQHSTHTHDHLSSICINIGHPLDRIEFLESIKKIPESVYRIKGTVEFTDCEAPCIFQFVNGRYDISEFHHPENTERYLICIGQHLNENTVRQLLGSYSEYHEHSRENAL